MGPSSDAQVSAAGSISSPERISAEDFERVSRLARRQFGLELARGKEELVSARLAKLMRQHGDANLHEFVRGMLEDTSGESLLNLIDALATNHTSFLREPAHFDYLRDTVLPAWRGRGPFRIWSAACSTGEEPYTLAFLLSDWGARVGMDFRVLATDISRRALAAARSAVYTADRCDCLGPEWLRRYFLRGNGRWEGHYRVRPNLTGKIEFRRLNLIEPFAPMRFDAIFCRNVMIYFSRDTQASLIGRLAACLEPGGHLFVGHAESLSGSPHAFEFVRPAVYRLPEAGVSKRVMP